MNPEDLKDFKPAWQLADEPPTRLPSDGAALSFESAGWDDGSHTDSEMPEPPLGELDTDERTLVRVGQGKYVATDAKDDDKKTDDELPGELTGDPVKFRSVDADDRGELSVELNDGEIDEISGIKNKEGKKDTIYIRGNSKNLGVAVVDADDITSSPPLLERLDFRDGLNIGGALDEEGTSPTDEILELPVVKDIANPAAVPPVVAQVRVSKDADRRIYTVQGNGVDRTIKFDYGDETEDDVELVFKDGLLTGSGDETVTIPTGGGGSGGGLPEGSEGDLLRHNGTGWEVLTGYTIKRVKLCDSGTPTDYDILAKPVPPPPEEEEE